MKSWEILKIRYSKIRDLWYTCARMPLLEIFGNILIPTLSGIILFIYFLYFAFIEESKTNSIRYFTVFLISFSVFLFGRPVQILSGGHPAPVIINNIRSFIFSTLTIPMVILADFSSPAKDRRFLFRPLISAGILIGVIYSFFNTITTTGSEVIFTIGHFNVYDSVTPSRVGPYYGREVTIAIYLILATILFLDSIAKIQRVGGYSANGGVNLKKVYLYNIGKMIFAFTFFFGALVHQWWIYYVGALVSVSFLGSGIALEIRENRARMQKVVAYIREDLIQDLSLDVQIHQQVSDMLKLLQIPEDINTFIVLKENPKGIGPEKPGLSDTVIKDATLLLDRILGSNHYILMPMGTDMLGICLPVNTDTDVCRSETIRICETLKSSMVIFRDFDFGIGRSYKGLEDLKRSYHEAVTAVEYAGRMEGGQVVHITDIHDEEPRREYPLKEKNAFLAAIRMGDGGKAQEQLKKLMALLFSYGNETDKLQKVRTYELLGTMVESAIAGGGDVDELLDLSEKLFSEQAMIRSTSQLAEWLKSRTDEIILIVSRSYSNRSKNLVIKAKEYINSHFAEAISVKDVAEAVCISESYFKSIFKKSSGYSYSEYLTSVRIDEAKNLLNTTEKSVTEIALDVGYQTPNSFSSLFKRETGLTPTQWKNFQKKSPKNR